MAVLRRRGEHTVVDEHRLERHGEGFVVGRALRAGGDGGDQALPQRLPRSSSAVQVGGGDAEDAAFPRRLEHELPVAPGPAGVRVAEVTVSEAGVGARHRTTPIMWWRVTRR